ncbi:ABC transporter ATP-binding protein [Thermoleophilia bacterium SCSIO 60948]|nr:ABC transporter ATP-binding protein [Thermoleophilia bacterium SCSIO 60948]
MASAGAARRYSLENVTKVYGSSDAQVRALDGVDLEVADSEYVVVVGPSGSGKSTLLALLGALDRPSGGTLTLDGTDLARASDRQLADLRARTIGFVFQQFNLIPTLSARANIEIAMAPLGTPKAEREHRAEELLSQVGLAGRAGHLPSQLSGGEQQRVAIARALANRPQVILADEPTGNLDSRSGAAVLELLHELWSRTGTTVILITHDTEITAGAPRVVEIADGRISSDRATASVER